MYPQYAAASLVSSSLGPPLLLSESMAPTIQYNALKAIKPSYRDSIEFVKGTVQKLDDRETLSAIFAAFEQMGDVDKKGLTLALGVDAAQYGGWKRSLSKDGPIHLNRKTKDSIDNLLNPDRPDSRLEGMEWALAKARATVVELALASEVRRQLRARLLAPDVKSPEDERKLAETAAKEMGGHRGDEGQSHAS